MIELDNASESGDVQSLDELERKYSDIKVALHRLENLNEELTKLSPVFSEAIELLDEVREEFLERLDHLDEWDVSQGWPFQNG